MKVIESENVIMYDVDDTLVIWETHFDELLEYVTIADPHDKMSYALQRHEPHIKLLKNHKARGKTIFVWSQGGYQWAEAVVKALGLSEYVDFIMSKPRAYVDDLPVEAWMRDRIYIKPDSAWGQGRSDEDTNTP